MKEINRQNVLRILELETILQQKKLDAQRIKEHQSIEVKTIYEGEGDERPSLGMKVTFHFTMTTVNDSERVLESSRQRYKAPFSCILDSKQILPSLEAALLQMKRGEVANVVIPSHLAYGKDGYANIPSDTDLIFRVELLDFTLHPKRERPKVVDL
ncbi:hypothetical protein CTEN210_16991 [Chaetoceros tenuissimus]|uniref:peptidylprolyl isomerase n=1 Tax=Chaetoceros tenuissimus TaxID=426638 RepID=A0AAD3HEC0_9STRA|nr:hypothetical protein CTEN210_16991 [Chaetoceros tenuissimus]